MAFHADGRRRAPRRRRDDCGGLAGQRSHRWRAHFHGPAVLGIGGCRAGRRAAAGALQDSGHRHRVRDHHPGGGRRALRRGRQQDLEVAGGRGFGGSGRRCTARGPEFETSAATPQYPPTALHSACDCLPLWPNIISALASEDFWLDTTARQSACFVS